jgi:hypothetical protein
MPSPLLMRDRAPDESPSSQYGQTVRLSRASIGVRIMLLFIL